tara:strand:+ start:807 stop:908 length:102 start_codon:yes stop_codon:yes gene_type:complete
VEAVEDEDDNVDLAGAMEILVRFVCNIANDGSV